MPATPPLAKTIRWSTFVRDFGPVTKANSVNDTEWKKAISEGRFATVYHTESGELAYAMPRHHGCVNTVCKIVFSKPLPPEVERIIGLKDSQSAFDICNGNDIKANE